SALSHHCEQSRIIFEGLDSSGNFTGFVRIHDQTAAFAADDSRDICFLGSYSEDGPSSSKDGVKLTGNNYAVESPAYGYDMHIAGSQNTRDLICRPKRKKSDDWAILTRCFQIVAICAIPNKHKAYSVLRKNARGIEERGPGPIETQIAGMKNDEISSTPNFADGRMILVSFERRQYGAIAHNGSAAGVNAFCYNE